MRRLALIAMVVVGVAWSTLSCRSTTVPQGPFPRPPALLEPIRRHTTLLENHAYLRMLLFFKDPTSLPGKEGDREEQAIDDATVGYGLGVWHLVEGHKDEAERILRQTMSLPAWAAFGAIAAEAEVARLEGR